MALLTAPTAAASGISTALSWTGLHDSHGIPIGSHFVSVVPILEAMREQGPEFSASPETWGPAIVSKVGTALTYTQLATWLSFECAALACMTAIAIWFVKFALSSIYLVWLAAIAQPVLASINTVIEKMQMIPGIFMICVAIGGVAAFTTGYGTGIGIIFSGLLVIALILFLLRNPVEDIAGDNGVLGIGRNLGLTIAQGFANNGPVTDGKGEHIEGSTAQLDAITSWLVDVLVRQTIQLVNFGQVIDDLPGCADLYNQAVLSPPANGSALAAPAHAMATCAPLALEHARQLDAVTVGLFGVLILVIAVVLMAICYVGCEVVRIGFRAFWNVLVIVPAAVVAIAPGPQRQFAKRTALKLVVHGVEMIVATVGLGVLLVILMHIARGNLPGLIGMTHPMAKVVLMLLVAIFGAIGFRQLLHAFGDRGLPGPVRTAGVAIRTLTRTNATVREASYARDRLGDWRSRRAERRRAGEDGKAASTNTSPKAPGRRAHPPVDPAPSRPPNAPDRHSASRSAPSGPGRENQRKSNPSSRTHGRASTQSRETTAPRGGSGQASAQTMAANAARTGAKLTPQGAAATAAERAASRLRGGTAGAKSSPPHVPGRTGQPPQATSSRTNTSESPTRGQSPAGPSDKSAPPPSRRNPDPPH
ncbi:hypothetical protein KL864_25490 [Mycolicibacterium goodii]|uniref:hypothetical protein n=1 Tax=Mycolicibacterium goodii TaxID=134601 RepID=UPI001BDC08F5|nr:hypothetical protein [Mycolicibacterium goodii]MBU8819252.1 hypothetical protein [Mycolicibacterium goodii]